MGTDGPEACGAASALAGDVDLSVVTRGDRVESVHRGAVVVVTRAGRVWARGDVESSLWARSAVKPFQALPLLERGIADRLGLGVRELALLSASHDGTEAHVAVVDRMLGAAGLSRDDLGCGPHAPFDKKSSFAIAASGGRPERVHNNCSGKHAGFLMLAQDLGAPVERYLDPYGPGQRLVRETVAAMVGVAADAIPVAGDGCGAPTLGVPLRGLALGFCRLMNPGGLEPVRADACARLRRAITEEPTLLSGENRICAALIRSAPGAVYPKNGAEGIYALGVESDRVPDGGFGLAVKVRDGAERGYWPVVVDLLLRLGLWDEIPDGLRRFARVPVLDTNKNQVGAVESVLAEGPSW